MMVFFLSSINLFGFGKLPFYFLLFSIFSHSVFVYVCHIRKMWICWIHTILIMPNENSPPASFIRFGISKQRIERNCETTCQTYLLAITPEISMELNIVNKFLSVPKHNKNWNQNRMIIYCVMSLERIQIKRYGVAVSVRATGTGIYYTHEMYWLRAAWCTRVCECACVLCVCGELTRFKTAINVWCHCKHYAVATCHVKNSKWCVFCHRLDT